MIGRIFTVGGLTLVSRATGFVRDIVLAVVLAFPRILADSRWRSS